MATNGIGHSTLRYITFVNTNFDIRF